MLYPRSSKAVICQLHLNKTERGGEGDPKGVQNTEFNPEVQRKGAPGWKLYSRTEP